MSGVGFGKVFYYKVIYTEFKCCLAVLVAPEACVILHMFVAVGLQFL